MTPEQQTRADAHSAYAWDRYLAGQPQEARLKLRIANWSREQQKAVWHSLQWHEASRQAYEAQKGLLAFWEHRRKNPT